jgi:hypothetical protein
MFRSIGTISCGLVLVAACGAEADSSARSLDFEAFGVAELVPVEAGYVLVDDRGDAVGSVDVDEGSLRVELHDEVGTMRWDEHGGVASCEGAEDPRECGGALAIAGEIAMSDELGIPWTPEFEADDTDFRIADDCGQLNLMWVSGCINWNAQQGCVDWMLCAVYDCSNDAYDHYVCFINF